MTGWHLAGTPLSIEERQPELEAFYHHLFPPKPPRQVVPVSIQAPENLSDADIVARATLAPSGLRFARLWSGDTASYDGDHSRADLALCGALTFWTGGDTERIDRLFRQSGLMRPKWDERHFGSGETYRVRTIARALSGFAFSSQPAGGSVSPRARQAH